MIFALPKTCTITTLPPFAPLCRVRRGLGSSAYDWACILATSEGRGRDGAASQAAAGPEIIGPEVIGAPDAASPAAGQAGRGPLPGILCLVAGAAVFSLQDVIIKLMND